MRNEEFGTALEMAAAIKVKKLSVAEVVGAYINIIEENDKQYNTFITVAKESAMRRAGEVQALIDKGETLSPLAGVPVSLKDNISTLDLETTCASKMLAGYKPVFNADVVDKLESAGLIVIGKNNMDEFAMGGSSETGAFGAVRNPWDTSRAAGGSSGGGAAAIAAGETPLAVGTDTGGSIGKPCSYCGVTGIKPTYGSVSRMGIAACASSLDQAGPMGKNIEDCAALLSIICAPDNKDSTCIGAALNDFGKAANSSGTEKEESKKEAKNNPTKIGVLRNFLTGGISQEVATAVFGAAKELQTSGAIVEELEMPLAEYLIPAYLIISSAELSSNLARYDGLKYGYRSENAKTLSEIYRLSRSQGFGIEAKRKIMLGSLMLSADCYNDYYKKAQQVRTLIKEAYNKLFEKFDILLSPVTPTTAPLLDSSLNDPMKMYMGGLFNVGVNLAGLPAVTLPCGFDKQGLPIGFQLIGNTFAENTIIDAARIYQQRTDHHRRKPNI